MKRFTPAFLAASTIGSKALRLIEVERSSSSSKLASFEMQARLTTASWPATAAANFGVSRISPSMMRRFGLLLGRNALPKNMMS